MTQKTLSFLEKVIRDQGITLHELSAASEYSLQYLRRCFRQAYLSEKAHTMLGYAVKDILLKRQRSLNEALVQWDKFFGGIRA